MKLFFKLLMASFLLLNCQGAAQPSKHIFYLHGRILELQGVNAVSEEYGAYEFRAIVDSLKSSGVTVHSEVRTEDTDFYEFCQRTVADIQKLIEVGVEPEDITVIGASKGGVMAMQISSMCIEPINYVLLGANADYLEDENEWSLHGRVLGIYEKSDSLAGKSYNHWIRESSEAKEFNQLEISTGLGHGFLYRPLSEWMNPAREWMDN